MVLVDGHPFYRHGLRELLIEHHIEVAGEAGSGERAIELVAQTAPDVIVSDLDLPGIGGVETTRRLTASAPMARVLILAVATSDETVVEAIMAGACGYLLKDAPAEQIAAAIRAAYSGDALLSPGIAAMLLDRLRTRERERELAQTPDGLSERELEVLKLIGAGKDNAEIAAMLFLSTSTVKTHISNILLKLQMDNRIQAAVYASRRGLL